MRSRERLIEISIWLALQDTIRKNGYYSISKGLLRVCNKDEKKGIDTSIEDLDRDIIESKLSKMAELLNI